MGVRRRARELAMQALFYLDMRNLDAKSTEGEDRLETFAKTCILSKKARPFFFNLVEGVLSSRSEIDTVIEKFSDNWKITRMSCVDRNIIRIAVYEILLCNDIPVKVSINEAIDIGKKFGTEESGAFINGILDSIHLALKKKEITFDLKRISVHPDDVTEKYQTVNSENDETNEINIKTQRIGSQNALSTPSSIPNSDNGDKILKRRKKIRT